MLISKWLLYIYIFFFWHLICWASPQKLYYIIKYSCLYKIHKKYPHIMTYFITAYILKYSFYVCVFNTQMVIKIQWVEYKHFFNRILYLKCALLDGWKTHKRIRKSTTIISHVQMVEQDDYTVHYSWHFFHDIHVQYQFHTSKDI